MQKRIICYFLVSIFLFGCASIQREDFSKEQAFLQPAKFLKLADLPVPAGLKFLDKNSYLFESGFLRIALLRYTGKIRGDKIVSFYKEQMPVYGWSLLNLAEYGNIILNFEKEKESCIITVQPKGSKSDVIISVAPRALTIKEIERQKPKK